MSPRPIATSGCQAATENVHSESDLVFARAQALNEAVFEGRLDDVRSFLDEGVSPNQSTREAEHPLLTAAMRGHGDIVDLLLSRGADIHACGSTGYTALHLAACFHASLIDRLIDAGADISSKSALGLNALMCACTNGNIDSVQVLLNHGVDLDDETAAGDRAEYMAARFNHHAVIDLIRSESARRALLEIADSSTGGCYESAGQ